MPLLVLLLLLLPFLEIHVFFVVGNAIGFVPTIALVLGLSVFGASLLRQQGLSALLATQQALTLGRMPVAAIYDSIGLSVAGALIVVPGFITDVFGFTLLVPPIRRWATKRVLGQFLADHIFQPEMPEAGPAKRPKPQRSPGPVIEGEYRRVDN
jgi:UPF0716 protein FxsA